MSESIRSRRVIALFAAYVVALQALLLPLSVAAGSAFDVESLRRGDVRRWLADAGRSRHRLPLRRRLRDAMLRADAGRPAGR